jgi:hypothetical protein
VNGSSIGQSHVRSLSGVPRNFFFWGGGGGFNKIELRTEDKENGNLGTVAP